jgi:hypothetical protein
LKSSFESGNEKSTSDSLVHILDFQFLNLGEPMLDLLSLFYTSLSPSVWSDVNYNFEPILRIYYKTLSDTVISHCQKENKTLPKSFEEFTFSELVNSFLKATMKGYVVLLVSYESLLSLMKTDDEKTDFIKRASLSTIHLLSSLSYES